MQNKISKCEYKLFSFLDFAHGGRIHVMPVIV